MGPELDDWLPDPALRITHRRSADVSAAALWDAARSIRIDDTALLGRLLRWRIPGTDGRMSFDRLFSARPFIVLDRADTELLSGIVGRIWTVRRDYPQLDDPAEFRSWSKPGTAKVLFANWATESTLHSETRVQAFGTQGRVGLAAIRPLVVAFHHLIASEGLEAAVRLAQQH